MQHQLHAVRHDPVPSLSPALPPSLVGRGSAISAHGTMRATSGFPATTLTLDLTGTRQLRAGNDLYLDGVRVGRITGGGDGALRLGIDPSALLAAMDLAQAKYAAVPSLPTVQSMPRLSPRQREVLALVASGCSNKHIALELGVSPATIKTHVATALATIGARNRTDAAIKAREQGWI